MRLKKNKTIIIFCFIILILGIIAVFSGIQASRFSATDVYDSFGNGWDSAVNDIFEVVADDGDIIEYADESIIFKESVKFSKDIASNFGLDSLKEKDYAKKEMSEAYTNGYNNAVLFIFSAAKTGKITDKSGKEYDANTFLITQ